jgi:hypothetical protein
MNTNTRPRSHWRKLLLALATLLFASAAFGTWYKVHYSMDEATASAVPGPPAAPKVLVATQSSDYKDAVTAGLLEHLKTRAAAVQVIDVGELATVQPEQWKAIVLIHTWEMGTPPSGVQDFIDKLPSLDRLVVHTTSGQGDGKPNGVDAVTGASTMEDVPAKVKELATRVDLVLAKK